MRRSGALLASAAVSGNLPAVLFALAGGVAGAIQVAVTGALGRRIGSLEAAAFSGLVAGVLFAVVVLVVRHNVGYVTASLRQPAWLWLSGAMGVVIVSAVTYAPAKIGVFATIGMFLASQLLVGALIDHFGLLGAERHPLGAMRLAGLGLLVAGSILVLRR